MYRPVSLPSLKKAAAGSPVVAFFIPKFLSSLLLIGQLRHRSRQETQQHNPVGGVYARV